jgi:hypothetical protein
MPGSGVVRSINKTPPTMLLVGVFVGCCAVFRTARTFARRRPYCPPRCARQCVCLMCTVHTVLHLPQPQPWKNSHETIVKRSRGARSRTQHTHTHTASSSYRNSTAFIWHSCGVRCPPRRLPPLRTSSPSISRSPSSLPSAVSRSSSPRIGALQGPA